jgi:F-type H+-transporting ATPase subunit b
MRRAAGLLLFAAALAVGQHPAGEAAHPAESAAEHGTEEHADSSQIWWKWANFALLAAGLGYVIGKHAGPFFVGRTAEIRKGMEEAAKARSAADARMRDIDARLANLSVEIASLKEASGREESAAVERARAQTAADVAKIQAHAEMEIAAAGKAAKMELKRYTSQLALELAEAKLRGRMTSEAQDSLVRDFAERLSERPS